MVIYTYKNGKLFVLNFLLALAETFEGLIALMTLGCVRFGISWRVFFKLSKMEMKMNSSVKNSSWPRICIWPLREKNE